MRHLSQLIARQLHSTGIKLAGAIACFIKPPAAGRTHGLTLSL
jgi:hypothetical protein